MEWEWYGNINTKILFIHCLLKANWKSGKFEGTTVPRGSFVTSIKQLSLELGLTNDEIRTALKHLIKTGEVTKQTTNKYTVITVSNYHLYQTEPKQIPNEFQAEPGQTPNEPHTITKLFPTIEERNKGRKEEKKNTPLKSPRGFVPPTMEEVRGYVESVGSQVDPEEFVAFYESKGWMVGKNKMKSWKSAIVTWEKRAGLKRIPPEKKGAMPREDSSQGEILAGDDWMDYGPGWRERNV